MGEHPPLHLSIVAIEKGTFGSPSTKVANFFFFYFYHMPNSAICIYIYIYIYTHTHIGISIDNVNFAICCFIFQYDLYSLKHIFTIEKQVFVLIQHRNHWIEFLDMLYQAYGCKKRTKHRAINQMTRRQVKNLTTVLRIKKKQNVQIIVLVNMKKSVCIEK